ncbi:MAG: hypothetical protein ACOYYU_02760 [Chloroflexota bacterium]
MVETWASHAIHQPPRPQVDEEASREDSIEIPVQANGKVRDRISVPTRGGDQACGAGERIREKIPGRKSAEESNRGAETIGECRGVV